MIPVTKKVSDYTKEELKQFYEQFAPVAQKWHKLNRRLKIIGALFFGPIIIVFIVLLITNPKIIPDRFLSWIAFGLLFLGVVIPLVSVLFVFIPLSRINKCPACHNRLDVYLLGDYCPECGSNQLEKKKWSLPKCNACGKRLTHYKRRRRYKIRFCTHCGVFLEEKGF